MICNVTQGCLINGITLVSLGFFELTGLQDYVTNLSDPEEEQPARGEEFIG